MLVVDYERSERGPQRRRDGNGRLLHCCCICGNLSRWSSHHSTYCSDKDIDDETAIPKFCSDECRERGGSKAENVTKEMRQTAKDAEWREPTLAYREETEREKYLRAADEQKQRRGRMPDADG